MTLSLSLPLSCSLTHPLSPLSLSLAHSLPPSLSLSPPDSFALSGAPLGGWRGMERGGESPAGPMQGSPERRGCSPDLAGLPPPMKKGRLELNGSPTGPRPRHNGSLQRPLGGERAEPCRC